MNPSTLLDTKYMWQHTWPSAEILCEFIVSNPKLWGGKCILELGAGAAALPSMAALRCGASKMVITEQSHLKKALDHLRCNIERNFDAVQIGDRVQIVGLDWLNVEEAVHALLDASSNIDLVIGSDLFYDPCVFEALIILLRRLFDLFPSMEMYLAYQIRDSEWSIEELLSDNRLNCTLIRCVDTTQHSICLCKITCALNKSNKMIFAGIEGGATHSNLLLIDDAGNKIGEWDNGPGLNCLLNGVEKTADQIASWIRAAVSSADTKVVELPIASLGMGLSGAEDEATNQRMLQYMKVQHADLATSFFLTSDSIAAVATSFENGALFFHFCNFVRSYDPLIFGFLGGVVLIAGTGSACRLLKANGAVHGVGGWGHLIGDGGGGFWIVMRAIKRIFDSEDGLLCGPSDEYNIEASRLDPIKQALLQHFQMDSKLALLDLLYNPLFSKSRIASFCKKISELAVGGDSFSLELFHDAGQELAKHLVSISRYLDEEMLHEVPVVMVGSVFRSWEFMKSGFVQCLTESNDGIKKEGRRIRAVRLYRLRSSPAVGAAFLGARFANNKGSLSFKKHQSKMLVDELILSRNNICIVSSKY